LFGLGCPVTLLADARRPLAIAGGLEVQAYCQRPERLRPSGLLAAS
jgi:hypothetical protein